MSGTGTAGGRVVDVVAFDGDDTLWHNESLFSLTQERFASLLARHVEREQLTELLLSVEMRNLRLFGYGIKGFILSMIETAIDVTGGRVEASEIQQIIDFGKEMLGHPVELLEGVRPTVERLAQRYRLMLVTKGDLFDQEGKIARSGLGELFWKIEIVSEKDEACYRRILDQNGIEPKAFVMVGNSLRSDILPVLAIGGRAVHVPYHVTWAHEHVDAADLPAQDILVLPDLWGLPELLESL